MHRDRARPTEPLRERARLGGMIRRALFVLSWVLFALALAACRPATGGASPSAGVWVGQLTGIATAGPVCPVERTPPDPSCAPRAVPGARLLVQDAAEH